MIRLTNLIQPYSHVLGCFLTINKQKIFKNVTIGLRNDKKYDIII